MPSIVSQIDYFEERIQKCENRLEVIKESLKTEDLSSVSRDTLLMEKEQLSSTLTEHQQSLRSLRHENRKSMMASVAILILFAIIYALSNFQN